MHAQPVMVAMIMAINAAMFDLTGRWQVTLNGRPCKHTVSRGACCFLHEGYVSKMSHDHTFCPERALMECTVLLFTEPDIKGNKQI